MASSGPSRSAPTPKRSRSSIGQIHPTHLVAVLHDVAEDVGDLQSHPQVVRERLGPLGVRGAVHGQAEPPDAARHPPAVADQIVEGAVAAAVDVHLAAVDEVVEGGEGDREATGDVGQGDQHGVVAVVGVVAGQSGHVLAGLGQGGQLVGHRAVTVADVVDPAGQGVQGAHGLALGRGQELDPVGKVPGLGGGDLLATEVGLGDVHAASPRRAAAPQRRGWRGLPLGRRSAWGLLGADRSRGRRRRPGRPGRRPRTPPPPSGPGRAGSAGAGSPHRDSAGPGRPGRPSGLAGRAKRAAPPSGRDGDPESGHVVGGEVDPAGLGILGDVLPVFGELEPGADRGPTRPLGRAWCRRRWPAPGVRLDWRKGGSSPTSSSKVAIGADHLVLAVGGDQITQRLGIGAQGSYASGPPGRRGDGHRAARGRPGPLRSAGPANPGPRAGHRGSRRPT